MLSISPAYRYHLYRKATDMRNGFDGLCGIVRSEFMKDPLSGNVFIFLNKRRNLIKLLVWHGDGYAIFYKRLERGTFELPDFGSDAASMEISSQQMLLINEGIQLSSVKKLRRYQPSIV